ncbi:MAG TPA: hypothetical protein VJ774_03150 [Actinomycetota bacterium]|nr:hypothetical protein [Actinomycetota bacterium]
MDTGAGVALIVSGSVVGVLTVFVLWRRIPAIVAFLATAVCGVCVGTGALLVQEDVGAASWAFALVVLATLAPVHARLVFGPPGRPQRPVVARTAPAA